MLSDTDSFSEGLSDSEPLVQAFSDKPQHDKVQNRKQRWNEYMRNYRAKQKQQQQEALNNPTIPIMFNGGISLCKSEDIKELLPKYTKVLVGLYNMNSDLFDDKLTDELNENLNSYINFSKILLNAFEDIIQNSPLTAYGAFHD